MFKNNQKKIVKKLSKQEIKEKKAEIKKKTELFKSKKITQINKNNKSDQKKSTIEIFSSDSDNNSVDICLKVKKCDIDSIASYLIKLSNEKDFPNISLRE